MENLDINEIILTKTEIKVLKKVANSNDYPLTHEQAKELVNKRLIVENTIFIKEERIKKPTGKYNISEKGSRYLEYLEQVQSNFKKSEFRSWITLIISLSTFIVSLITLLIKLNEQ